MNTMQEIEQALGRLSSAERAHVAAWLQELEGTDYRVAEPAAAYNLTPANRLSVDEYLKLEETAALRHEYIGGEIHAMSGASESHNTIAGNVFTALRTRLKGGPCRVYVSDFKVRLNVANEDIFYYPDVLVSCHPSGIERLYLRFPTVVVEVLSPSTATTDRREKLLNYRQAQTLEEYCLISQNSREVTLYRRSKGWIAEVFTRPEDKLELSSVGQGLSVAEVYADMRW